MNKDNILKVADAIEQHSIPDLGFNMGSWFEPKAYEEDDRSGRRCGTTACIAGWAVAVSGADIGKLLSYEIREAAIEFLQLEGTEPTRLFEMWQRNPGPAEASRVLRHLAETGEVDWSVGAP